MNKAEEEKALEFLKSKHNGELPYKFGRQEIGKWMAEYAQQEAVNFVMWNEHAPESDRDIYEETYQDWLADLEERKIIKDSEPKTPPPE